MTRRVAVAMRTEEYQSMDAPPVEPSSDTATQVQGAIATPTGMRDLPDGERSAVASGSDTLGVSGQDLGADPDAVRPRVILELFTSTFCGACLHTRSVLTRAVALIPGAELHEYDVALDPQRARDSCITSNPTVIVRDGRATEVHRASGVPTLDQVLVAAERALHQRAS